MTKRGRPIATEITLQDSEAISNRIMGFPKRKSMLRAGFDTDYANKSHDDYWKRPRIVAELERRVDRVTEKHEITEDWIIERIARIADANPATLFEVDENGDLDFNATGKESQLGAILSGVQLGGYVKKEDGVERRVVKIAMKDQLAALRALMRIKGMDQVKVMHNADADLIERLRAGRSRVSSAEDGDVSVGGGGT